MLLLLFIVAVGLVAAVVVFYFSLYFSTTFPQKRSLLDVTSSYIHRSEASLQKANELSFIPYEQ